GDRVEQVVVVAVAATGLIADLEAVGQRLEHPHHLVDGADLGAAHDLPARSRRERRSRCACRGYPDRRRALVPPEVDVPWERRHCVPGYPTDRGFLHSLTTSV